MDLEDLAKVVENLEVPPSCDGLREYYRLVGILEAKGAPAVDAVHHSGEWEIEGAASLNAGLVCSPNTKQH